MPQLNHLCAPRKSFPRPAHRLQRRSQRHLGLRNPRTRQLGQPGHLPARRRLQPGRLPRPPGNPLKNPRPNPNLPPGKRPLRETSLHAHETNLRHPLEGPGALRQRHPDGVVLRFLQRRRVGRDFGREDGQQYAAGGVPELARLRRELCEGDCADGAFEQDRAEEANATGEEEEDVRNQPARSSHRVQHHHPGRRPAARRLRPAPPVRLLLAPSPVHHVRPRPHAQLCRLANRRPVEPLAHLDPTHPQLPDDRRSASDRPDGKVEGAAFRDAEQADPDECGGARGDLFGDSVADFDSVREGKARGSHPEIAGGASVPL
uniref:(northern house mosquito) hypothetical protein n=1 Tax=Culex pipiens TaxID=7175 RepID=A0A8D8BIW6_CULPI